MACNPALRTHQSLATGGGRAHGTSGAGVSAGMVRAIGWAMGLKWFLGFWKKSAKIIEHNSFPSWL